MQQNDQIDVALNSFLASRALSTPSERLSPEGRELVADVREVVKQAKNLLLSKNEGNLLQDFIWQTTQFDPSAVSTPGAPVDKSTAKQHGDEALAGLRTLGTLVLTNGQFRKLLKDAVVLLRVMMGDAAANAAGRVRPSDEAVAQMDRPADDNTWHDAPDFSKENIRKQVQGVYKKGGADEAAPVTAGETAPPNAAGATPAGAVASIPAEVPQETQDAAKSKAKEYRERTRAYMRQKMPQERRDQTVYRLKKMILECQLHPDYRVAIETLLDLAEQYGSHAKTLSSEGTGTVKDTRSSLIQAEADLKTLLERFANGTSSDGLWASIDAIYQDADKDPELKGWFKDVDRYIRRCLLEAGYILDESSTHEWNRLYDRGDYLLRDKYKSHTDRITDELRFLMNQFDADAQNKAFAAAVTKLFTDLGNDENGKAAFKPHLLKDITEVIVPAIFENIAYIPIPRIEYSDPQVDAIIENLVLESDNFYPNLFEVATENYFSYGRKLGAKAASKNKHSVEVKVGGIQMDLRDVSYHVKRKQGFPSLTDTGVANILLAGDGFSFKLKMGTPDSKDSQTFFKVHSVKVDVKHLKITLLKSKHKLLFSTFKPIMLRVLRPALQKAVEKAIRDNASKLDAALYQIKLEADRALEDARNTPNDELAEQAPNIYSRYISAVQKQILQGKKKAEEVVADKKVNYAVTREESMFPDIRLPGGISTKATEYRELARKGDKWESPVFSIGAASKSSDIPPAPKIEKKVVNGNSAVNGANTALGTTR